jgi:electron transport complex protein RnfD
MIGAFFMATDYVTAPLTRTGKIIFGAGAGIITVIIRLYGGFPEGVCYAILLMNAAAPLIERYTQPMPYGLKNK